MKLGGGMGIGPERRPIYLGADPDIGADQGIVFSGDHWIFAEALYALMPFLCSYAIEGYSMSLRKP